MKLMFNMIGFEMAMGKVDS